MRESEFQPFRDGAAMVRMARPWTPTVHALLAHLRDAGFAAAPAPLSFDDRIESVSFLPGMTGDLDDGAMRSELVLQTAGRLLRRYHDASASFLNHQRFGTQIWQLSPREPAEVICHGDFAPYNVVVRDGETVGIIDFETAHPGPRLWDLAYAVYRWAPLGIGLCGAGIGTEADRLARARVFLDAYGLADQERIRLTLMIVERLDALVAFMSREAAGGSEKYSQNIADGDGRLYRLDRNYIANNADTIAMALIGEG